MRTSIPGCAPWYQLASQHVGKMVWTEPYYDYTNGTLVIALARAITDKEGKVRGLRGGCHPGPFSAQLNRQWNSGYQMIVNQSGKVLAHPDPSQLLKPMTHPTWLSRFSGRTASSWIRRLASSWPTAACLTTTGC